MPGNKERERAKVWLPRQMKCFALFAAVAIMQGCEAQAKDAQRPVGGSLDAVSLRRIAEAVEGTPAGDAAYAVIVPGTVDGPLEILPNFEVAEKRRIELGERAQIHGPFRTPPWEYLAACTHLTGSRWFVERDQCVGPRNPVRLDDLDGLILVLLRSDGTRDSLTLAAGVDAVFLSTASIDKFAIPYYARLLGLPEAARIREGVAKSFPPATPPQR